MILRLLIVALLVYLLFLVIYSSLKGLRRRKQGQKEQPGEHMVLDPHCKSYVPKKDAYMEKGHYFCSKECAQAYLGA